MFICNEFIIYDFESEFIVCVKCCKFILTLCLGVCVYTTVCVCVCCVVY